MFANAADVVTDGGGKGADEAVYALIIAKASAIDQLSAGNKVA